MKPKHAVEIMICLVLVVGMVLTGCAKREITSEGIDPTGTYDLVSVNGEEVPASVSHGGVGVKVVSGTFVIKADGTCLSKTVFVPPNSDEIEREVAATYTQDGPTLTMKWTGAGMTVGTVEGNTFTMDNEGMVFVYRK